MVGMQLPQLCCPAASRALTAPQHETLQTSLRSLHKMMQTSLGSLHKMMAATGTIAASTAFAAHAGLAGLMSAALQAPDRPLRDPARVSSGPPRWNAKRIAAAMAGPRAPTPRGAKNPECSPGPCR